MRLEGLELSPLSQGNTAIPYPGGAQSGAFPANLKHVVDNWGSLTENDRRRIRAIVDGRLAWWPQGRGGRSSADFGGAVAGVTAARAERLGSLVEDEPIPTEVAELAAVWHGLPDAGRAGIVAMERASGG